MRREIFGPVVTVYVYDEKRVDDDARPVRLRRRRTRSPARSSRTDRRAIEHAATALRNAAGNFYVNDKPTGAVVGQQPFGGARASGTNDKAGIDVNLIRWVSAADDQGDVRAADRLPLPVHGGGVGHLNRLGRKADEYWVDEERREFFRVMVRLPVRCLAVAADGSASLMMVRSVDLSAGGVCVVTDRALRPGDGVRLAFEVADGTSFKLEGHVVRADRLRDGMHRYGLEFAELDLGTEQRMFKAVFEQEQVNAGRHAHVRMTVWEPVTCTLDGEPHGFPAHALQLSARRRPDHHAPVAD